MSTKSKKHAKFFFTSDKRFLINTEKIAFIELNVYGGRQVTDNENNPLYANVDKNKITCATTISNTNSTYLPLFTDYNFINASYFNVYIDGSESPLKLKYADGVMLINFIGNESVGGIFANQYSGDAVNINNLSDDLSVININNTTYECKQITLPMLILNSNTMATSLSELTFMGGDCDKIMTSDIAVLREDVTV